MNFIRTLFLPLLVLILFFSCQNEESDIINQQDDLISGNSTIANLMSNIALNDGSIDNIIDYANCLEVLLPVTVNVNGVTITIESITDYNALEVLLEAFSTDDNEVGITFPIIVVLNDYSQIIIDNQDEFEVQIANCNGENEADDDIECIDFQYPIAFSIYNTDFQVTEVTTVDNDETLYQFLETLEGPILASLNFPIIMILANGETIEVNSNQELEIVINDAEGNCDEDDDFDYGDDSDCTEASTALALVECNWNIVSYNGANDLIIWDIHFQSNNIFVFTDGNVASEGQWSLSETSDGVFLEFYDLVDGNENIQVIAGSWLLVDCDYDRFELVNGQETIVLEQNCNPANNCNQTAVSDNLLSCGQIPSLNGYTASFTSFSFQDNNIISTLFEGDLFFDGSWDIATIGGYLYVFIDFNGLEEYNGQWKVMECASGELILEQGDDTLVLLNNCNTTNIFDCFEDITVTICDNDDTLDLFTAFDIDAIYQDCAQNDIVVNFYNTNTDAEAGVNTLASPYTNVANPDVLYARVEFVNDPNTFQIFTVTIIVENCSTSCTEADVDGSLQMCVWTITNYAGDSGFDSFDINFQDNQNMTITSDNETYTGNWSTSGSSGQVVVSFSNISGGNVQILNGDFNVVECTGEQMILHDVNNSNNELVLDKDCN